MFMVIEHVFFKEYFIDKYLKYLSNIYTLRNILRFKNSKRSFLVLDLIFFRVYLHSLIHWQGVKLLCDTVWVCECTSVCATLIHTHCGSRGKR